jgi:hypothetical protein
MPISDLSNKETEGLNPFRGLDVFFLCVLRSLVLYGGSVLRPRSSVKCLKY